MRRTIVACVVTALAVGGPAAYAANEIGSGNVKDGSLRSEDIHNGTIRSVDIQQGNVRTGDVKNGTLQCRDFATSVRTLACSKSATGPRGPQGVPGAPGADAASPTMRGLTPPFAGTNASVAATLDGVQFGPYDDGGATGGSVVYSGANGLTLADISQLSFTVKYSTANDAPIGTPYLRVFLEGDTHDVIFDATECATTSPSEDEFHTFEVTAGDVRYDDDGCDGVPPDQQPWADVVAAHGDEVISGIYVTTGFSGGNTLSAILRSFSVNSNAFTFGVS